MSAFGCWFCGLTPSGARKTVAGCVRRYSLRLSLAPPARDFLSRLASARRVPLSHEVYERLLKSDVKYRFAINMASLKK
jgi:hypothetical protein